LSSVELSPPPLPLVFAHAPSLVFSFRFISACCVLFCSAPLWSSHFPPPFHESISPGHSAQIPLPCLWPTVFFAQPTFGGLGTGVVYFPPGFRSGPPRLWRKFFPIRFSVVDPHWFLRTSPPLDQLLALIAFSPPRPFFNRPTSFRGCLFWPRWFCPPWAARSIQV